MGDVTTYQTKGPEDFGRGDRVRIHVHPFCDAAGQAHGFMHNKVNELVGTISWAQYQLESAPDHVWRVEYDSGHFGWHRPDELRDYVAEVIAEAADAKAGEDAP